MRRGSRRGSGGYAAALYLVLCVVVAGLGWFAVAPALQRSDAAAQPLPSAPEASIGSTASPVATAPAPPTQTATPTPSPSPTPSPVPKPTRAPFDMDVYRPGTFVSQSDKEACMPAAVQNMLNIVGPKIDLSTDRQEQISSLLTELTTKTDSLNGGHGPQAWALAMPRLGAGRYRLVVDPTIDAALRDAALAIRSTGRPAGLLTWRGAHSWVMTGFRSDADPLLFPRDFRLSGAYIVDPFYPRLSSIWGQTLGPDTFRDPAEMAENYLPWKRPEGRYPDRDGQFLLVVPVRG